jgi:predicted branched-subunit amino acid permease
VFLALLWPALKTARARWVAVAGAGIAIAVIPLAPRGLPVIAAAGVALVAGLLPLRDRAAPAEAGMSER